MPKPGPTDTVPALLTPGEHVMNREAVALIGADNLVKANQAGLKMRQQNVQGYQNGGLVSGIYRNGNSFSDRQTPRSTPFSLSSAPTISTPSPVFQTEGQNTNNIAKEIIGDTGAQSAIGAAVKPVYDTSSASSFAPPVSYGTSGINNLDTGFIGTNTPLKNNPLQGSILQGYQNGGEVKGIFAMRRAAGPTDTELRAKMFANSTPSQVGNISFLENTDLQGFQDGGEVDKDKVPHPITELQKPVTPGPLTNYVSEYKRLPVVPAIGKAMSDFGSAYAEGAKNVGGIAAQGAKGVYNAIITKPDASFKSFLYGEGAQTPAEKLFSASPEQPTAVNTAQIPKTETAKAESKVPQVMQKNAGIPLASNIPLPAEQMLPGAKNIARFGDKGSITSANTAGINRVNAMVAAGGLSNPEKEARFARDAANTAAQTAKYGDGKPTQPSEIDKLREIAINGGATGDMTPTQFGNAKRRQNAAKEVLGILGHLQQSKQQYDIQNKSLAQGSEIAGLKAAYDREKDAADRELKRQELAQKTNNVVKVVAEPIDPDNPMLGTKDVVRTVDASTGRVIDPEAEAQKLATRKASMLKLLDDPAKPLKYKQQLQAQFDREFGSDATPQ